MPLQRFWNAWLCVLTSPATAIRPFASMTLPARGRPAAVGGADPRDLAADDLDRRARHDAVLLSVRAAEDRSRVGHDEIGLRRPVPRHVVPAVAHETPPVMTRASLLSLCSLPPSAALVPAADDELSATSPTSANASDPEQRRGDDGGEQLLGRELGAVVVDQAADARIALAEEEVADDRADHREPGRDPQARRRSPAARPGTRASRAASSGSPGAARRGRAALPARCAARTACS